MIWLVCIPGVLLFVALSALFSGSETGIYCVNRLRLRLRSDHGQPRAVRLRRLLDDEQQALAVILVGTNVANYLTTVTAALLLSSRLGLSDRGVEVYTTLLVTPLLFVFGEVLPKNLFQREADRLLYMCSLPLVAARLVLFPAVWVIRRISSAVMAALGLGEHRRPLDHRARVAGLLREALAAGEEARQHGEFVERVLRLSDTPIRSVMVPAEQVISLPATADREAFLRLVERSRHSRFPVHQEDRSRITGVVDAHELLSDPAWERVGQKVHPAPRLHPDASAASAIVQVRRAGLRMAVVTGTEGKMLGIVTLNDLLEEVVGELAA